MGLSAWKAYGGNRWALRCNPSSGNLHPTEGYLLLGPVAISLAAALGLPPEPLLVCTALGAVASFLVPIGHHGNLLILNPGQYTFGDFVRVGAPLTLLIGLTSAWMARALWLDGPLVPTLRHLQVFVAG